MKAFWQTTTVLLAVILALSIGATVLAVTTKSGGKGLTAVRVVREDSTTGSATANSTNYTDIPGASTSMVVPSGTKALLVARFQGHGSIIKTSSCIVRIVVNGSETVMQPSGNFPFMGQASVSASQPGSGMIERSAAVPAGTYSLKAQLRIGTANSVDSECQLSAWHFTVERFQR
jgi:hypothetical protein